VVDIMPGLLNRRNGDFTRWIEVYKLWRLLTIPINVLLQRDDLERPAPARSDEEKQAMEGVRAALFQRLNRLSFAHPCRANYFQYVSWLARMERFLQISPENMDDE